MSESHYQAELGRCQFASERYAQMLRRRYQKNTQEIITTEYRQNFVGPLVYASPLLIFVQLDAQLEIQALCEAMIEPTRLWVPEIFGHYEEKRLRKARLAP